MGREGMSRTLPKAAGASPRPNPHDTSRSVDDSFHDTQQELKMLNWYKLANEAAMKAALVKHKRFKEVPRYNPAAERVRQRTTWLEQVIAEEQNKPLELDAQAYKALMMKEAAERESHKEQTAERHRKIVALKEELKDKEQRKLKYRKFLAEQEQQRKKAGATGLDAIYGAEEDEEVQVGMSADVLASLHSLEQLEERVQTILLDENTKAPGSIVLDLTNAAKDVGVMTVRNSHQDTLSAEQVAFVKRRTEPRVGHPSQVLYTAKVVPSNHVRKDALIARNTFFAMDVPEHVMEHMQQIEDARAFDQSRSRASLGRSGKSRGGVGGGQKSLEQAIAQSKAEQSQRLAAREEDQQREREEQERVDEVIKEWLRGRNRRALKRDKKMRDIMRADRRFLSQLQVAKEAKTPLAANPLEGSSAPAGTGWTPNVDPRTPAQGDYNTDDVDRKLDVLLAQQKQMEKWKPRKGGSAIM